jgi:4-aminobutyrate---pyruvate transaminase
MSTLGGERMSELEPVFLSAFEALTDHPLVGDFSGVGLIGGLDLVIDKGKRKAISADIAARVDHHAREHGLILRMVGNRIALSPPLIISGAEIAELATRLRGALEATWAELPSSSAEMALA